MFVARENELKTLNSLLKVDKSSLCVVYGRRRIGKTETIRYFIKKRYDKILHLAQSEQKNNFKLLLTPIKSHFPKESYEIIINKCNKLMNSFGRNRNTYNEICDLLNIIIKVPTIKDDTVAYIKNNLANTKPKLPALLDELQKAKLL